MNNKLIPCGLEDERCRFEPNHMDLARATEDYADNLMDDCKVLAMAELTNRDNDIYDGETLPKMMCEIANWTGSSEDAVKRMKVLFNILADEFQKIAEREIEA